MKYLILLGLLGDPNSFAIVNIDPNSYEVEGYVMQCNCKTECKPKPIYGTIRNNGDIEAVDESGKLYIFK